MKISLHKICTISLFILVAGFSNVANATLINTRAELNTILGGLGVTEDFETLVVPVGAGVIQGPVLNSSTGAANLVVDGVNFMSIAPDLPLIQWNGVGYYGQQSQNILAQGALRIDFSVIIDAVGMDLGVFNGIGDIAAIKVFGSDDTSLLAEFSGIDLGFDGAVDTFFGFYEQGNIGAIEISGINPWSPLLDNLTFGTEYQAPGGPNGGGGGANPIPEPATAFMLLIGLLGLAKRRI